MKTNSNLLLGILLKIVHIFHILINHFAHPIVHEKKTQKENEISIDSSKKKKRRKTANDHKTFKNKKYRDLNTSMCIYIILS